MWTINSEEAFFYVSRTLLTWTCRRSNFPLPQFLSHLLSAKPKPLGTWTLLISLGSSGRILPLRIEEVKIWRVFSWTVSISWTLSRCMIELKVHVNFFCGFHCVKLFGYTSEHVSVCTNFVIDRKFVNKTQQWIWKQSW